MGMAVGSGSSGDDDNGYKPLAEINVTPFVDVMLVLLIIFMVAAPLMVQGVPLELPKTSATKLGAIKKPMVVSLSTDGKLYIRDEEVTAQTLVSRLMDIKASEGDGVVYVRADRKIAYGEVMELLGKVGESGFSRVSLLSQPSPSAKSEMN
ncbi:Biopolymer transport exbD protein [Hyphomicrobium sp. GJ21]|uniref:Biopolymer transport protein ExbD/TolR n=1 Tax=Hyphomicrobium denitrificans (strain ATCC 51888 / DSM 1869 / NCIMB 11706 / TK 0415) TaxID=582899 RepID=D8JQV4_HYPDA|nr:MULTISPECIES: biopolymer transporter ExbD [Hyphomicrobium]ADJ22106.1 Biopolymer transport protein ExbD/TolR [Hyphomicrobium denitrificans ATCC 51888]MBN9354178.1 biopolymer transporter ExbD [Hyphomicrobium denitrificans]CEJ87108.1 Biopolymer transport exbD protein [Hyphomicrobium sp. GJ21]